MLRFSAIDEILIDLNALESAHSADTLRQLGNWPPGSIFDHLASAINGLFSGFDGFTFPLYLRLLTPLVKDRMLNTPFPSGFHLSKAGESKAWKRGVTFADGIALYRSQLARVARRHPESRHERRHPAFGRITPADWLLYQLRHAELHLSFLRPE